MLNIGTQGIHNAGASAHDRRFTAHSWLRLSTFNVQVRGVDPCLTCDASCYSKGAERKIMKMIGRIGTLGGGALIVALTGCVAYVDPAGQARVYVPPAPVAVELP